MLKSWQVAYNQKSWFKLAGGGGGIWDGARWYFAHLNIVPGG